jgi:hypothetical protein
MMIRRGQVVNRMGEPTLDRVGSRQGFVLEQQFSPMSCAGSADTIMYYLRGKVATTYAHNLPV